MIRKPGERFAERFVTLAVREDIAPPIPQSEAARDFMARRGLRAKAGAANHPFGLGVIPDSLDQSRVSEWRGFSGARPESPRCAPRLHADKTPAFPQRTFHRTSSLGMNSRPTQEARGEARSSEIFGTSHFTGAKRP